MPPHSRLRHAYHDTGISHHQLDQLMAFKASERKDDPIRRPGLHGPYEELVLMQTGRLPDDYYSPGDPEPWGLRRKESQSNIAYQILNGMLDHAPAFAADYLHLALDTGLTDVLYALELAKIHTAWRKYNGPHIHTDRMKGQYSAVACPACTVATATAFICEDSGRLALFRELLPLSSEDRIELLRGHGLLESFTRQMTLQIPDYTGEHAPPSPLKFSR